MREMCVVCSVLVVVFGGCAGDGEEWIELEQARDPISSCVGQRAAVPASLSVSRAVGPPVDQPESTRAADYVSYQLFGPEIFVYFSFLPGLPESPTTDDVRTLLKYSYIDFNLKQPPDIGGSLTLSRDLVLLHVADFEQLEVIGGQLRWRFRGETSGTYEKDLTLYDQDPTNDPSDIDTCLITDVLGECTCHFGGPPMTFNLTGTIPL